MDPATKQLVINAGFGIAALLALGFILVVASLIYHWHYYGISKAHRTILMTVFVVVGLVLILAAFGLLIQLTI
jgi:hypothetical protein